MALQSKKAGLPPGSMVHIGEQKVEDTDVRQITFSKGRYNYLGCKNLKELKAIEVTDDLRWINITGLHDPEIIAQVGQMFNLHPLLTEDIVDTSIRPKVEEYDNCLFMSVKILNLDDEKKLISVDQISFVLGNNWLITFLEKPNTLFNALIKRMELGKGKVPEKGVDYLCFRLVDIIVDHYFFVVEHVNDLVLNLEEQVIDNPNPSLRAEILNLKKQLINFNKMVYPLREKFSYFAKDSNEFISEYSIRYYEDVHENVGQIIDAISTEREMLNNVMDLYQSGVSNKMNQVMQFLTVVSTIFIPLTFIAGLYGMNFVNMPELDWKYGYFFTMGLMVLITIGMVRYFKKKDWF